MEPKAAGTTSITGRNDNPDRVTTLMTGRNDNPNLRGAFTLLELILVLVLISVLLGIAAPSLRGFVGARRSADAAAQLLSLADYARSQAIARGTVCRPNVDADENVYWLTMLSNGVFVELDTEFGRRFSLPDTVAVGIESAAAGPGATYVQFYPSGRSDEAVIQLIGVQGEVFIVANPSATESFRILAGSEADAL